MLNSGESTTTYKLDRCVMKSLNFLNLIAHAVPLWWVLTSGSVMVKENLFKKKSYRLRKSNFITINIWITSTGITTMRIINIIEIIFFPNGNGYTTRDDDSRFIVFEKILQCYE
jgi:hypothetical protein